MVLTIPHFVSNIDVTLKKLPNANDYEHQNGRINRRGIFQNFSFLGISVQDIFDWSYGTSSAEFRELSVVLGADSEINKLLLETDVK